MPIIRLIEGSGGGGSVKTIETTGRANLPGGLTETTSFDLVANKMGQVPVVALGLGSVAGLGAARLAASHYSVMVKESSAVFVAGPPVVERLGEPRTKQELGGWQIQLRCGAVDHAVDTEDEAFAAARRFLSYLPSSVYDAAAARARLGRPAPPRRGLICGDPQDEEAGLPHAPDHRVACSIRTASSRWATVRPPDHHRLRPPRRLAGGGDGRRSAVRRRRLDGGRLQQDHPLRRSWRRPSICRWCIWWIARASRLGWGGEHRGHPLGRARAVGASTRPRCPGAA